MRFPGLSDGGILDANPGRESLAGKICIEKLIVCYILSGKGL